MRRPSPATTPRRHKSRSRSRSRASSSGSSHGHGGGGGDDATSIGVGGSSGSRRSSSRFAPSAASQSFTFDEEQVSRLREERSADDNAMNSGRSSTELHHTPPKSARQHILSPLQSLTPTKLQHTLGNIGITTPSRGRNRTYMYLASPQSSFALSPTSASSSSKERAIRCLCRKNVLRIMLPVMWMGIMVGITIWSGNGSGGRVNTIEEAASTTTSKARTTKSEVTTKAITKGGYKNDDLREAKLDPEAVLELHEHAFEDGTADADADADVGVPEHVLENDENSDSKDGRKLEDGYDLVVGGSLKDGNEVDNSSDAASDVMPTNLISEQDAFRRMLDRAVESRTKCELEQTSSLRSRQTAAATTSLPPFGIIDSLEQYLSSTATAKGAQPSVGQCQLPPATSCHERNYTVYINAQHKSIDPRYHQKHNRAIIIMALRALSLPSSSEILIGYDGTRKDLQWDKNYGRRLLMWHFDSNHPVKISFRHGINGYDSDKFGSEQFHPRLSATRNEAILYIPMVNAEIDFSSGGIEAGFCLWRRHSNRIVLSDSGGKEDTDGTDGKATGVADVDKSQCPIGNDDKIREDYRAYTGLYSSPVFVHRNYSCFFDHDIFSHLRQALQRESEATDNQRAESIALFIHIAIAQLSGASPRLFPAVLHRKRVVAKQSQSRIDMVEKIKEKEEARRRLSVEGTDQDTSSLVSLVISVSAYFGSSIPSASAWCGSSGLSRDSSLCGRTNGLVTIDMLPWMNTGGSDNDTCSLT